MIHFLPDSDLAPVAPPADALARVAGLDQALAAAQSLVADQAPDGSYRTAPKLDLAAAWPTASEAQQALFDAMSAHAVAGSVAGLEVLATLREAGLEANRAAIDTLTASIRDELDRLGTLLTL
ncbi:MAG: hypothetical protein V4696_08285 [Pseudomonadota bacterium]